MLEKTEKLLTASDVAHRLKVDETTVRRWIKSGLLEAIILQVPKQRVPTRNC